MTDLSELHNKENPALVEIKAIVNGRKVSRSVPVHYRVIDFVREELKLTGNKRDAALESAAPAQCLLTAS